MFLDICLRQPVFGSPIGTGQDAALNVKNSTDIPERCKPILCGTREGLENGFEQSPCSTRGGLEPIIRVLRSTKIRHFSTTVVAQ